MVIPLIMLRIVMMALSYWMVEVVILTVLFVGLDILIVVMVTRYIRLLKDLTHDQRIELKPFVSFC
jgi:positive regulator of sigma E activity